MIRLKTAIAVSTIVALLSLGGALAFPEIIGGNGDSGLSPEKAAVLQAEAERQQESAKKAPAPVLITPIESCSKEPTSGSFIKPYDSGPFPQKAAVNFVNVGHTILSAGQSIWIYAGAVSNDRAQGVLFVQQEQHDPCAAALGNEAVEAVSSYLIPEKLGRITLTLFSGDSVQFTTDSGVKGSFDLNKRQFTVDGTVLAPLPTPTAPGAEPAAPVPTASAGQIDSPIVPTPLAPSPAVPGAN